uniref:Uncharacterized protein n=1 Tax=Anopheles merus TaxID=30066 RepID=A0A182VMK0_ANOME
MLLRDNIDEESTRLIFFVIGFRHMWQILSVSAHLEQELCPQRNATFRRRSMQMLQHRSADSSRPSFEPSSGQPAAVVRRSMCSPQVRHFFIRTPHSAQAIWCWQGSNTISASVSLHTMHSRGASVGGSGGCGGGTGGGVGLAEDAAPALAGAAGVGGWGTLLSCTNCRGLLCFAAAAAAALVVVPNMPDRWLAPPRHGFIIGFANIPTAGGVTSAPAVVASRAAAAAAAAACPRLRRAGVGGLLLLLLLLPPAGPLEEEDDGGGGGEVPFSSASDPLPAASASFSTRPLPPLTASMLGAAVVEPAGAMLIPSKLHSNCWVSSSALGRLREHEPAAAEPRPWATG